MTTTSVGHGPTATASPVRAALVGVGYWGTNILRNLMELPALDLELRWLCDLNEQRLHHASALAPGARLTTSLVEVLSDPGTDAVLAAVPPCQHLALAERVLAAGKHLFLEKPMALCLSDAEHIARAAEHQNLVFMVGLIYRYNSWIHRIKRLLDEGALGEVRGLYSQRSSVREGKRHASVLWSLAPHDVSIVDFLFGSSPVTVRALQQVNGYGASDDVALLDLSYPTGVVARVYLNWREDPKTRLMVIFGSRKLLVFDETSADRKLVLLPNPYRNGEAPWRAAHHEFQAYRPPRGPAAELISLDPTPGEPLRNECAHFLSCVRSGAMPSTGIREGLEVTRILDALQRSLDLSGRTLPLDSRGSRPAAAPC